MPDARFEVFNVPSIVLKKNPPFLSVGFFFWATLYKICGNLARFVICREFFTFELLCVWVRIWCPSPPSHFALRSYVTNRSSSSFFFLGNCVTLGCNRSKVRNIRS